MIISLCANNYTIKARELTKTKQVKVDWEDSMS